ncbi:hypothetical protein Tco_1150225, partial [Tanacetum coccineum]
IIEEKIKTQDVLDLEDKNREKRGNKEWQEVRITRAKERSTNSKFHLIITFVKYLKEILEMFVQLQRDWKELLDKGILLIERGEGVADFKRRLQDFQGDGVMDLTMALGHIRLKVAQKDSTWFQQRQDESLYKTWTRFKDLLLKFPHHGLDLWLQVQIFYDHFDYTTQMAIDYAAGGRLRKLRPEVAWETIEDLA